MWVAKEQLADLCRAPCIAAGPEWITPDPEWIRPDPEWISTRDQHRIPSGSASDPEWISTGSRSGSTPDPEWISGFSYEYTVAVATSNRGARTLSQIWGALSADTA